MPTDHVGVMAFAAVPLTDARIQGAAGSADLRVVLGGGAARFLFTTRASRWAPTADLGVTAVSLKSTGVANEGYLPSAPGAVTAAPFGRVGLAFAPIPQLRLRADVLVGGIPAGVSIRFAKHEVATWGRPFALASAGVDFGWF